MDARVEATRLRLSEAILRLAAEKDVSLVTVAELARAAEIDRSTFYAHASSPRALLEQVLGADLDPLRFEVEDLLDRDPAALRTVSSQLTARLLDHVEGYQAIYADRSTDSPSSALHSVLSQHVQTSFTLVFQHLDELAAAGHALPARAEDPDAPYLAAFLAHGLVGAISVWLEKPAPRRCAPPHPTRETERRSHMKAAVVHQTTGHFDVEDGIRIAEPIGHEVLIDVKASGLCHSDLHLAENDFGYPLPMVLGHELAGVVTAVGPEVTDVAVGDHVVGSLVQSCGHCASCRAGRSYQCANPNETLRDPADGSRLTDASGAAVYQGMGLAAFAEQALVHENQLAKVPADIPWAQAALLGCGVVTGAGAAINTAGVRSGDTVAVIGAGGVGLNVVQGARLAGAERIIVIDLQPAKLELAKKFGATEVINPADGDAVAKVLELTGGGVDHAFEVIGLKATSEQAIKMARMGGGAYLIGVHKPGAAIEVDPLVDLLTLQKKVQGVFMGSTNIKHDIPMYAALYLQGRFNLDDLVSKEISLSEINEAYEELKGGNIARSVITSF